MQLTFTSRVQDVYGGEMAHWVLQYGFETVGEGVRFLLRVLDGQIKLLDEEV